MSYLFYAIFLSFIFVAFYFIGGAFKYLFKLSDKLGNTLIGASISFGSLFLLSFLLIYYERSFNDLFLLLSIFYGSLVLIGILKTKIEIKKFHILFIVAFVLLFILLSSRIPLGEQMGDNVFYFLETSLNIDNPILQSFDQNNGIIYDHLVFYNDTYFTFYLFFSYIIKIATLISSQFHLIQYPTYVYNMWLANGLFFGLFGLIILNLVDYFKLKSKLLIISLFSFLALFIGTYYFHLSLAHIGNTFLYIFLSFSIVVIIEYLENPRISTLWLLSLIFYAIISAGNVGVIISFYCAFGLFVLSLLLKDKYAFLMISFLFIPIFHYLFLLAPVDGTLASLKIFSNIIGLPITVVAFIVLSYLLYKLDKWHKTLFRISYVVMILIWLALLALNLFGIQDYFNQVLQFSDIKANFDRVIDYFTFDSFRSSFINLIQYGMLVSLFFNSKTRKMGYFVLIIILFFINAFMYPFIYSKILWLYHRAYFTIFNISILGIGLIALFKRLELKKMHISLLTIPFILISIYYGYVNLSEPINPIYIPSATFNPIYKLPQEQVDILETTRQIIEIEQIDTPIVVSQIYGTLFYLERINQISFTTALRRGLYYADSYDELNQIFYTPVFPGDDGLRLSAPVKKTCQLLMDSRTEFVIFDKDLSVYDEEVGNWIPTYWYARDCYTKTYENDRYILYRFFWD